MTTHYNTYVANGAEHDPKHRYDCENCKFGWCCGPCCACHLRAPDPPEERLIEVAGLLAKWRGSIGHSDSIEHALEDVRRH